MINSTARDSARQRRPLRTSTRCGGLTSVPNRTEAPRPPPGVGRDIPRKPPPVCGVDGGPGGTVATGPGEGGDDTSMLMVNCRDEQGLFRFSNVCSVLCALSRKVHTG